MRPTQIVKKFQRLAQRAEQSDAAMFGRADALRQLQELRAASPDLFSGLVQQHDREQDAAWSFVPGGRPAGRVTLAEMLMDR